MLKKQRPFFDSLLFSARMIFLSEEKAMGGYSAEQSEAAPSLLLWLVNRD
jgi:hypothetical protein